MNKKLILVIVEGRSDREALGSFFINNFSDDNVAIRVYNGDITSGKKNTAENIENKIESIVEEAMNLYGVTSKDVKNIIHLVDTDGTYIDDNLVVYNNKHKRAYYTEEGIKTSNPDQVKIRNNRKRNNLEILLNIKNIFGVIPYNIYYLSANLDHVLYDKMNCNSKEKVKSAISFSLKYRNDMEGFLNFLINSSFSKCDDYEESWTFIKENNNSLKRFSNLGICFK